MQAFRVLLHALRQVFGNFNQVLLMSAPPLAIQAVLLGVELNWMTDSDDSRPSLGQFAAHLTYFLVDVFSFTWLAVRWHRFVLLNEHTDLLAPPSLGAMLRYAGFVLLVPLVLLFTMRVSLAFATVIASALGQWPAIAIIVVLAVLWFCLLLILWTALPGIAIGTPRPIRVAWNNLKPARGTVFLLAVVGVLYIILINTTFSELGESGLPLGFIMPVSTAFYWLTWLIGISVLTTLWGHYVEGRPLH